MYWVVRNSPLMLTLFCAGRNTMVGNQKIRVGAHSVGLGNKVARTTVGRNAETTTVLPTSATGHPGRQLQLQKAELWLWNKQ